MGHFLIVSKADKIEEYKKISDIVLCNNGSNEEFIENVRECLGSI